MHQYLPLSSHPPSSFHLENLPASPIHRFRGSDGPSVWCASKRIKQNTPQLVCCCPQSIGCSIAISTTHRTIRLPVVLCLPSSQLVIARLLKLDIFSQIADLPKGTASTTSTISLRPMHHSRPLHCKHNLPVSFDHSTCKIRYISITFNPCQSIAWHLSGTPVGGLINHVLITEIRP